MWLTECKAKVFVSCCSRILEHKNNKWKTNFVLYREWFTLIVILRSASNSAHEGTCETLEQNCLSSTNTNTNTITATQHQACHYNVCISVPLSKLVCPQKYENDRKISSHFSDPNTPMTQLLFVHLIHDIFGREQISQDLYQPLVWQMTIQAHKDLQGILNALEL